VETPNAVMVRAQALQGFRPLVAELGGNPARLLKAAKINAASFCRSDTFIDFDALSRLLERAADQLGCPDFGLRLAGRQDIGILGPLAVAMRSSATLGEAMRCASKYIYIHNAAIGFTVETTDHSSQALLSLNVLAEHDRQRAQTREHGIGITCRIVGMLSAGRSAPIRAWLPHAPVGSRAAYHRHLGVPVAFGAPHTALAIDRRDLDLPLSEHNEELRLLAIDYLELRFPERRMSLVARVRAVIDRLLGTGACNCTDVAGAFAMHPRTLQRRLRDEGTTFEEIKDEARRTRAERWLAMPDVPLSQITALLDYGEQSALSRSCQRWFHMAPRAVRARLSDKPTLAVAR